MVIKSCVSEIKNKGCKISEVSDWSNELLSWISSETVLGDGVSTKADVKISQSRAECCNSCSKGSNIIDLIVLSIQAKRFKLSQVAEFSTDILNSDSCEMIHANF